MEIKLLRYIPFGIAGIGILLWFAAQACIIRHCLFYDTVRIIGLPILLPLGIYAAFAVLPALIAARSARTVFMRWLWFAMGWTAFSVFAAALAPVQIGSPFTQLPLTRNLVALMAGVLFALASAGIIVRLKAKN